MIYFHTRLKLSVKNETCENRNNFALKNRLNYREIRLQLKLHLSSKLSGTPEINQIEKK